MGSIRAKVMGLVGVFLIGLALQAFIIYGIVGSAGASASPEVAATVRQGLYWLLGSSLALAALAVLGGAAVLRSFSAPLAQAQALFDSMARRNLTFRLDASPSHEFKPLMQSANQAAEAMRLLLRTIGEQAET